MFCPPKLEKTYSHPLTDRQSTRFGSTTIPSTESAFPADNKVRFTVHNVSRPACANPAILGPTSLPSVQQHNDHAPITSHDDGHVVSNGMLRAPGMPFVELNSSNIHHRQPRRKPRHSKHALLSWSCINIHLFVGIPHPNIKRISIGCLTDSSACLRSNIFARGFTRFDSRLIVGIDVHFVGVETDSSPKQGN